VTLGQHDGDGIRYAMHLSAPKGGTAQMLRDPAGGWVSWEDYARLKAEVERLTKAGDELHAFLINYIVDSRISSAYLNKLDDGWNAAKEGKQS
jgi:hypothetical protein